MERPAWLDDEGKPKYKILCPVSYTQRLIRLSAGERKVAKNVDLTEDDKSVRSELSALEQQFDWPLHQMVGYMRRLDGACGKTLRG
jgi:hypothetical protein